MSRKIDWPALIGLGLGRLRLAPEQFWTMSPGEFRMAVEGLCGPRPSPPGLPALMAAFPDQPESEAR